MTTSAQPSEGRETFPGGGETGALIRAFDWSRTPLGPISSWQCSLKAVVRAVLHSRHPMFLWWGPELIQLYNDAYLPSFGKGKHPAAMGQRGRECWPEIWPIIEPQIRDVMERGKASWNENQLVPIFRNGHIEDVYWTYGYSPVFDDAGAIAGTLVVCTETTHSVVARQQVDRARLDAEIARESLRSIFMQAPMAFCILTGPEYRFTLANPPYVALVGREVLDKTLTQAFSEAEVGAYRPILDDVYRTGEPFAIREAEVPLRDAQGGVQLLYLDFAYHAYRNADRAIAGVMVIAQDVTAAVVTRHRIEELAAQEARARERAEAMVAALERAVQERRTLASAIEQSGDFIGIARPDGGGLYLNLAGRRLLGLGAQDDLDKLRMLDFFPPDQEAAFRDEVLPAVARAGRWEGELAFRHFVTGERIAVLFTLFEVRDPAGAVIALGTVTRDIRAQNAHDRERAVLLEREQALRREAEASGRARDEFLAMLGHELRNPLAPISTATQVMRLRGNHHEKERQVIERQVTHLSRLVDDLLDVARIARGMIDLHREPVEISGIASRAIEMASPLLEDREHRFSVEVPREGLLVDGDPVRLAQVLGNLLTNAAKYTAPRGQITLRAVRDGGDVVITVIDDGPGVPPSLLPRIFDLFVQGQRSVDRAEGGLGLGLALVKNLVALHGGSVTAKNRAHAGCEFSVRLPALDPAAPQLASPAAEHAAVMTRSPRRVLVVDDNVDAADLLCDLLRSIGHEVVVAFDGPQALEALRSFRAEVGLLDIGLPVMDGFELARRIRAEHPDRALRLIAVTGYGQERDREGTRLAGFERHLTKPVDMDELVGIIEELH